MCCSIVLPLSLSFVEKSMKNLNNQRVDQANGVNCLVLTTNQNKKNTLQS